MELTTMSQDLEEKWTVVSVNKNEMILRRAGGDEKTTFRRLR
jgi:hypothetical protein